MAYTVANLTVTFAAALAGAGFIGVNTPKLSLGVALSLATWLPAVTGISADAGVAGVGASLGVPFSAIVIPSLAAAIAGQGLAGTATPQLVAGLSAGVLTSLGQIQAVGQHPAVGSGSGVVTFATTPSAVPYCLAAFTNASLVGVEAVKLATGLGLGLTAIVQSMVIPIAIFGSGSTVPSAGSGVVRLV